MNRFPHAGSWLLLAAILFAAAAASATSRFPQLTGRVVDGADLLSSSAEAELTAQLAQHEAETTNQVVVVTLPTLQGYTIEEFGYQLGRHWGIGQAEKNNGVLLIVAPNERKTRIEVGYGLEGTLTDAVASSIIQTEILPAFRANDFQQGVVNGTSAILKAISGSYVLKPDYQYPSAPITDMSEPEWKSLVAFLFWLSLLVMTFLFRDRIAPHASGWLDGRKFGGVGGGGSGGSFGGGGGGGFGGGGGGFGGGGASGGW